MIEVINWKQDQVHNLVPTDILLKIKAIVPLHESNGSYTQLLLLIQSGERFRGLRLFD